MAAGFYGGYAPQNFFVRSYVPGGAAYPFTYRPYGFLPGFQLPWWGRPPALIWGAAYPGAAFLPPWVYPGMTPSLPYGSPAMAPALPYGYPYAWAQPAAAVFMPVSVVRPVAPPWYQRYPAQQAVAPFQALPGYPLTQVALAAVQSQIPLARPLAAPEVLAQVRVLRRAHGKVSSESGSVVGSPAWKAGKDESSQWSKSA